MNKLARKNSQQPLFHPKNTLTSNGKNEKNEIFEYFEDLFYTTLRMQPNLTKSSKATLIVHISHLRGLALRTIKTIPNTTTTTLVDTLKAFRRKQVNPKKLSF